VNRDNYPIVVFWSDSDGCWIADVPDLESCTAHGDTAEEAVREALVARTACIEAARDHGLPLLDPSSSPHLPWFARESSSEQAMVASAAVGTESGEGAAK
jgi:predicted RNase H-like HicB family nuclease